MSNTFGKIFRITSFGESHGTAVGVLVDGCPSQLDIDETFIQSELDRRKPGQSKITTQRKESDKFEIISGVFEGKTTGAPIAVIIKNNDPRSKDYEHIKDQYRPSHADYTYDVKYGHRDYRGGGRSSARITAGWVVAGAIAKLVLKKNNIDCKAYVSQVGTLQLKTPYYELDLSKTEENIVRCPDQEVAKEMETYINAVRLDADTVGGVVTGVITGVPSGLGEPVFDKLHAKLGEAMLTINAVKGFEFGSGFKGVEMKGSEHNDPFVINAGKVSTTNNFSGGIQGGISNGEDIYFNVAFKPVATIMRNQKSINSQYQEVEVSGRGRHDPCVVPRAVPIVEAMSAVVMLDFFLLSRLNQLN